jgi:transcriptional regulator with PAS, ATPase and Fis domain
MALREARKRNQKIQRRLRKNDGNVTQTAQELGESVKLVRQLRIAAGIPAYRGRPVVVTGCREIEKDAVRASLEASGGNVKRAARETGVPENTVRNWKKKMLREAEAVSTEDGGGA